MKSVTSRKPILCKLIKNFASILYKHTTFLSFCEEEQQNINKFSNDIVSDRIYNMKILLFKQDRKMFVNYLHGTQFEIKNLNQFICMGSLENSKPTTILTVLINDRK